MADRPTPARWSGCRRVVGAGLLTGPRGWQGALPALSIYRSCPCDLVVDDISRASHRRPSRRRRPRHLKEAQPPTTPAPAPGAPVPWSPHPDAQRPLCRTSAHGHERTSATAGARRRDAAEAVRRAAMERWRAPVRHGRGWTVRERGWSGLRRREIDVGTGRRAHRGVATGKGVGRARGRTHGHAVPTAAHADGPRPDGCRGSAAGEAEGCCVTFGSVIWGSLSWTSFVTERGDGVE
jgi:hypothetical protein